MKAKNPAFNVHGLAQCGMNGFDKATLVMGGPWSTAECPVSDFSGIQGLVVREKGVQLPWSAIEFDQTLRQLPHIEYLDIEFDSKVILPDLQVLRNLKRLHLFAPKLAKAVSLPNQIETAEVWWTKNLGDLLQKQGLKQLTLRRGWNRPDFSDLVGLRALSKLDVIIARPLIALSGLEALKELTSFSLYSAPHLKDLSALAQCSQIRSLYLTCCKSIASVEPLASMHNLEELQLGDCGTLNSLAPLMALPKLRKLNLGNSVIKDGRLAFLRSLPSMREVRLQHFGHYDTDLRNGL